MLALHRRVERGRDKPDVINGQFIVIVIVVYSTMVLVISQVFTEEVFFLCS